MSATSSSGDERALKTSESHSSDEIASPFPTTETPFRAESPVVVTAERNKREEVLKDEADSEILSSNAFEDCQSAPTATSAYQSPAGWAVEDVLESPLWEGDAKNAPGTEKWERGEEEEEGGPFEEDDQSERIEEVNISTPSAATLVTNPNNNSVPLQATPPTGRKVRADSSQWIASRQAALSQLRAELEERVALSTPSPRRHSTSVRTGRGNKEESLLAKDVTPPEKLNFNEVSDVSPKVQKDNTQEEMEEEEVTGVSDAKLSTTAGGDTFIRNMSNISNISPDRNDMVSILAALYGTPSYQVGRSPSPEKKLSNFQPETKEDTTSTPPNRSRQSHSRSPVDRSTLQERKRKRLQKLRDEMAARDLAECTFHPTLSPGTRAMRAIQEQSRIAELEEQGPKETNTAEANKRERRELWSTVYDRLYPSDLVETAQQKHQLEQEMDYKIQARNEMFVLRSHSRAMFKTETHENGFKIFLSNIMNYDCRTASPEELIENDVLVESNYKSPMAYALLEESKNRKKLAATRRSNLTGSEREESGKEFRIALFDNFLLRQNAFHQRRRKRLQDLVKSETPEFKPSTTAQSSKLVKSLLERTAMSQGIPEDVTRQMKKHIPVAGKFVKKHRSKYNDECTFQPDLTVPLDGKLCSGSTDSISSNRFSVLHGDYQRILNNRERALQEKKNSELDGYTFKPRLNTNRNKNVNSTLTAANYPSLTSYVSRRQEELEAQKRENEAKAEISAIEFCTFRPKTTKKPAYISNMSSDFGVLRSVDTEF